MSGIFADEQRDPHLMTSAVFSIAPADGRITAFGIAIDADIKAEDLPALFSKTCQAANIEGRPVSCVFASATGTVDNMTAELTLRFENELLVSAFITLTPPRFRNLSGDDFYNSADDRQRVHARWLRSIGIAATPASFPWGEVGIARDRSENVHIYVHTRNNTWAR
ncbi:hypothetical protein ACGLHS_14320 [Variovorax sp. VaC1]|uniref:hypothetical protein n=1 Tax=Variovorax sp. VaC1 TaxID=3373132 RepID=UPI003749248F